MWIIPNDEFEWEFCEIRQVSKSWFHIYRYILELNLTYFQVSPSLTIIYYRISITVHTYLNTIQY